MQSLGMEEGVPIEAGMVSKAIERAQKQVEAQNFGTRKHLLEYDDVMNKQRENIYALRREILDGKIRLDNEGEDELIDTREYLMTLAETLVDSLVDTHAGKDTDPSEWDLTALANAYGESFGVDPEHVDALKLGELSPGEMKEKLSELATEEYEAKEKIIDPAILRRVERDIMLQIVDAQWKDHLYALDHLKEGIGLRGYGQRDPLVEYKKESFNLFQAMKDRIDEEMVRYLWRLRPVPSSAEGDAPAPPPVQIRQPARKPAAMTFSGGSENAGASAFAGAKNVNAPGGAAPKPARTGGDDAAIKTVRNDGPQIGRNDPCWCGSGKKFKKCHGA